MGVTWWDEHPGDVTTVETAEAHDETVAFILDFLSRFEPGWVIDLGCGVGRLAVPIAEARPDLSIIGYDTSAVALVTALREMPDHVRNLTFADRLGGGTNPMWKAVWSALVFQHLTAAEIGSYLAICEKALLPGGAILFQFVPPVGEPIHQPQLHEHAFREMATMCSQAGLAVELPGRGPMDPLWCWLIGRKPT